MKKFKKTETIEHEVFVGAWTSNGVYMSSLENNTHFFRHEDQIGADIITVERVG